MFYVFHVDRKKMLKHSSGKIKFYCLYSNYVNHICRKYFFKRKMAYKSSQKYITHFFSMIDVKYVTVFIGL